MQVELDYYVDRLSASDPRIVELTAAVDFIGKYRYLTRLYSRLSVEEMNVDPYFEPLSVSTEEIPDVLQREIVVPCQSTEATLPCDFQYCGRHGACVHGSDDTALCACDEDAVAREFLGPIGPEVRCVSLNDALEPDEIEEEGSACDDFSCEGTCVELDGKPTCRCEDPAEGARRNDSDLGGLACVSFRSARPAAPKFPPIDGPRLLPGEPAKSSGCSMGWGATHPSLGWLLVGGAFASRVWARRRRGRSAQDLHRS
jgi:hypothetical protein